MTQPQHSQHPPKTQAADPDTHNSDLKNAPSALTITRIRQIDFLAQLTQALALYDADGDGLLSDDDWQRVAQDLQRTA